MEINESVGIIVTARTNSSRIKNKVLQKINGKYSIEILLDNVISHDDKFPVILAIPENSDDDILEEIGNNKGVNVYRGYDDSPLHRLYYAGKEYGLSHVVRITADDILIDQTLMRNQIKHHVKGGHEYTFMRKCPEGIAGEVIKIDVLKKIIDKVKDKPVEFISYYLKNRVKTFEYYPDYAYQYPVRLTMDYDEDLLLLRLIFAAIPEPIRTLDIIHFLKSHPYFLQINRLPTITVYTCIYNHEAYLLDCIDSVINQTYQDFEFIIIDDSSDDDTSSFILEWYSNLNDYQKKIVFIHRNVENLGLSSSCNIAIDKARGKYIVRIDSDDVMDNIFLETMVENFKLEGVQGIISGFWETDENLDVYEQKKPDFTHAGCAMFSRWACNEIKFRDGIEYLEGKEFFSRFKSQYKTMEIQQPLWKYRQHSNQKSKDKEHPNNK